MTKVERIIRNYYEDSKWLVDYLKSPIKGYVIGYGHDEINDSRMGNKYYPTYEEALAEAKKSRLEEIDYNMDYYSESREEALQDTFTFYIGEVRQGHSTIWLKEIDPISGRVCDTTM